MEKQRKPANAKASKLTQAPRPTDMVESIRQLVYKPEYTAVATATQAARHA